ncbi:hypothetical protein SAMN05192539_1014112 [Paraburkholderia diazotrophica]|uniref:Uncharacterized protein n=1 Tax=Paraburkholderia diazotrophica TaxID=667676 RepID=A0A1H7ALJ3_9BURK|nr:hypothetical protein SAMN05192539_1014112 [Paraburkholderia diazotrophica]
MADMAKSVDRRPRDSCALRSLSGLTERCAGMKQGGYSPMSDGV